MHRRGPGRSGGRAEEFGLIRTVRRAASIVMAAGIVVASGGEVLVCVANLSPVPRHDYRVGLPAAGRWVEVLNTDATGYSGSGIGNLGAVVADAQPAHGQAASARFTLPPLAVVWFEPDGGA